MLSLINHNEYGLSFSISFFLNDNLPQISYSWQDYTNCCSPYFLSWQSFIRKTSLEVSESEVAQLCPTLATPCTAAHQAPPPMGFSRQEYWSGVPLPSLLSCATDPVLTRATFIPSQSTSADLTIISSMNFCQNTWCLTRPTKEQLNGLAAVKFIAIF